MEYILHVAGRIEGRGCPDEKLPGIYIPARLTEIAQNQIDMLNRLGENRCYGLFEIAVRRDNPAYETDEAGCLHCGEAQQ